jgi:hypothetical protein
MKADDRYEVCSYDDLSVLWRDGRLRLQCPECGPVAVPLHETTLSDLTNAAMTHLSEHHADSLTLPGPLRRTPDDPVALSPAPVAPAVSVEPAEREGPEGWRLIELLGPEGAGGELEALVRALANRSEHEILEFDQWLKAAAARLDTPEHARQRILDLDRSTSVELREMTTEEFSRVRVAVVAAGRRTYAAVLADPTRLTRGWPLSSAQRVLEAPAAAFRRVAGRTLAEPEPHRRPRGRRSA